MKKLADITANEIKRIATTDEALKARRAVEVQEMWKDAIEYVYKDVAPQVLSHVNAVYIKEGELIVYMDDSNFRSDVHCRQHLLLLRLREHFGENISSFKTLHARFDMKRRHPYKAAPQKAPAKPRPLSAADINKITELSARVDNEAVRQAFEHAMTSAAQWGSSADKTDKTDKADKTDRAGKPGRADSADKTGRADKAGEVDSANKANKANKTGRVDRATPPAKREKKQNEHSV